LTCRSGAGEELTTCSHFEDFPEFPENPQKYIVPKGFKSCFKIRKKIVFLRGTVLRSGCQLFSLIECVFLPETGRFSHGGFYSGFLILSGSGNERIFYKVNDLKTVL
jgi:hypothetical protein